MINLKDAITSTVGKKILNGLSALGAVVFVFVHLGGNLTLFGGAEAFNAYAAKLHALGPLLYVLEFGLIGVFLLHIWSGIAATLDSTSARSESYESSQETKGGPSNFNLASTQMIVSGVVILLFMVVHLLQFRLRHWWDALTIDGTTIDAQNYYKHLSGMVEMTFADPLWVAFYCGTMLFLGLHARHGIWSMFQSIGAMNKRWKATIYTLSLILAILLALGFFVLPIWVHFAPPHPA